jgi:hypothetical protein
MWQSTAAKSMSARATGKLYSLNMSTVRKHQHRRSDAKQIDISYIALYVYVVAHLHLRWHDDGFEC